MSEIDNKTISPIKRVALALVDSLRDQILTNCSDEEVTSSLVKFHPESNGYFNPKMFATADECMRMLHIRDRNKFFTLMKKHGIKNHQKENQTGGFLKSDIEKLIMKM